MRLPTKSDCFSAIRAFPVIILCGIFGILPDVDHIAAFLIGVPKGGDFRVWHPTIFLIVGIAIFCLGAFSTGLYIRAILRNKARLSQSCQTIEVTIGETRVRDGIYLPPDVDE